MPWGIFVTKTHSVFHPSLNEDSLWIITSVNVQKSHAAWDEKQVLILPLVSCGRGHGTHSNKLGGFSLFTDRNIISQGMKSKVRHVFFCFSFLSFLVRGFMLLLVYILFKAIEIPQNGKEKLTFSDGFLTCAYVHRLWTPQTLLGCKWI